LIFGYKWWFKTKGIKPKEADFYTGKDEIDREEAAFLAYKAANAKEGKSGNWFYKTFISWLF
jgi:amino acid transporter